MRQGLKDKDFKAESSGNAGLFRLRNKGKRRVRKTGFSAMVGWALPAGMKPRPRANI